ncbi:hemolysin activation protein [Flavobacterium terrigena]|uniref:Hemolysin activation protein n=1 Tax=Flavobacterium terrigena TaxID=402734 RepID=A0A1H6QZ87_9FLAO|nr:hemolysin activation protein [Flavobacterium terrigena]SEI48929.1 hypothetical protein SAMN05660918_0895 [Flavobacterium terrigena]
MKSEIHEHRNDNNISMSKNNFLIDIPVLIIFFARPKPFGKVMEQIRIAKPSRLYLYQDGAREGRQDDVENINKCRELAENIDWDCQVFYKYQEKNYGCDPSEYIAQKWFFENEESGIVLEDDDVPSQAFFPYCKELLERYKYDERINMICGMNQMEVYENTPYSYTFSTSGSITGWASWRRVFASWEENYDFLSDAYALQNIKDEMGEKLYKSYIKHCTDHKNSGKAHYESIFGSAAILNNRLNIVPKYNLISNIGIDSYATHGATSMDILPKGIKKIFYMKAYEIEFPLKHPKYIIEDKNYKKRIDRIMGNGYPLVQIYRQVESISYRLMKGETKSIFNGLKRRLGL